MDKLLHILYVEWEVITHLCLDFGGGLVKSRLVAPFTNMV